MQRGQNEWKKGNIISKNCGTITNSVNTHNGNNREERQKKGKKEIFVKFVQNIVTKNFPKLIIGNKLQVQEAQRTSSRINEIKSIHRHTIFKCRKSKTNVQVYPATSLYLLFLIAVCVWSIQDFPYKYACHLKKVTVLLSFTIWIIFLSFSYLMLWLEFPELGCITVVRTDIPVSFLILEKKLSTVFYHWIYQLRVSQTWPLLEKEMKKKFLFAIATKSVKYLRINLKDVKDLCTEIYIIKRD